MLYALVRRIGPAESGKSFLFRHLKSLIVAEPTHLPLRKTISLAPSFSFQ